MKTINFHIEQDKSLHSSGSRFFHHDQIELPTKHADALSNQRRNSSVDWADLPGDLIGRLFIQPSRAMRETCTSWRDFTTLHLRELRPNKRIKTEQLEEMAQKFSQLTYLNLNACSELKLTNLKSLKPLIYLRSLNLANRWSVGKEEISILNFFAHLTKLDLSNWRFEEHCDLYEIQSLTQLRSLILKRCQGVGKEVILGVARLQNLVALDLAQCKQTETGDLAHLSSLISLTQLDLSRCRGNNATLIALSSLIKIKELNLTGFSNISQEGFLGLKSLQSLQQAIFSECKKICIRSLQKSLLGKTLTVLDLKGCELLCKKSYELIGKITSLRALTLSHSTSMNDKHCGLLSPLSQLKHLDLSSTLVTEKSFGHLNQWSDLQSLSLNHCYLLQFDHLTRLRSLHQLNSLNASMRRSSSANALGALTCIRELTTLKLWGNQIVDDQGLRALSDLSQLQHLQLADFPQVTEMGLNNVLKLRQLRSLKCMDFKHIGQESRNRLSRKRKSIEIDFH